MPPHRHLLSPPWLLFSVHIVPADVATPSSAPQPTSGDGPSVRVQPTATPRARPAYSRASRNLSPSLPHPSGEGAKTAPLPPPTPLRPFARRASRWLAGPHPRRSRVAPAPYPPPSRRRRPAVTSPRGAPPASSPLRCSESAPFCCCPSRSLLTLDGRAPSHGTLLRTSSVSSAPLHGAGTSVLPTSRQQVLRLLTSLQISYRFSSSATILNSSYVAL